jgi:hypothetical protein
VMAINIVIQKIFFIIFIFSFVFFLYCQMTTWVGLARWLTCLNFGFSFLNLFF